MSWASNAPTSRASSPRCAASISAPESVERVPLTSIVARARCGALVTETTVVSHSCAVWLARDEGIEALGSELTA